MLREKDISDIYEHFSTKDISNSLDLAIGMCQTRLGSEKHANFNNIIEKETHYLLERKGYKWNSEAGNFDNLNRVDYDDARENVKEALTFYLLMGYYSSKNKPTRI